MVFSILICSSIVTVVLSKESGGGMPTSFTGNIGMYGNGFGDVYAGKIKEGVYGAGLRFGGNIGVTGSGGFGRKRREVGMKAFGFPAAVAPSSPEEENLSRRRRGSGLKLETTGTSSMAGAGNGEMFTMAAAAAGKAQLNFGDFRPPATTAATDDTTEKPRKKSGREDSKKKQEVLTTVSPPSSTRPATTVGPSSGPRPVTTVIPPPIVPQNNVMRPASSVFMPSKALLPDVSGAYARFSFALPSLTETGAVIINSTSGTY